MKRHLGKKAMAIIAAAMLMVSAVPLGAIAEEAAEDTIQAAVENESTQQTTEVQETEQATAEATVETQGTEQKTDDVTVQEKELSVLSASEESDFEFDASTGMITKYKGNGGDVIIPDTIGGVKVTTIGESAFQNCTALSNITLPDSVVSIGRQAFSNCKNLVSVNIPYGVTVIENYTFASCNSLKDIEIPNSVTSIQAGPFNGCESLTSLVIPSSVTSIHDNGIRHVSPNTKISIDSANTSFSIEDGVLYDKGKTKLLSYPVYREGHFTIPDSVTTIGEWAFYHSRGLTGITIPNSVTTIENYAFWNCTPLTSITIPSSVTSIYGLTFMWEDYKPTIKKLIFEGNAPQLMGTDTVEYTHEDNVRLLESMDITVYYKKDATDFTTPKWHHFPCYPLEETNTDDNTDNTPSQEQTTPSGDILDIAELSKEEQSAVEEKVLEILNKENLGENEEIYFYDIILKNKVTGEIYTKDNFPKEGVTVTIPYPAGMNKNSHLFRLFHFADGADGEGTEVKVTLTDEGIQFHVYSLSPFVLVTDEKPLVTEEAPQETEVTSPKTGDNSISIWLMVSMLVAGAGSILIIKKKATRA